MSNPRNIVQRRTIVELRRAAKHAKAPIWRAAAAALEAPRSRRTEVNLSKIDRLTKRGDIVLVPGKVLGTGSLTHSVTVGAYAFSAAAIRKIREAKGTALGMSDFMKFKGKEVKLIGG